MQATIPITTMKLWDKKAMDQNSNVSVSDIDLREITANGFFSLAYLFGGAGRLKFECFMAAVKGGDYVEDDADIISSVSGGGAQVATTKRACSSNVATITTAAAHNLSAGEYVHLTGMKDSSYNGVHLVASAPDGTSFTFALTHADETEVADTSGLAVEVKVGIVSFTPTIPLPWMKIKMTEINIGTIALADVWLNVQ